jgi:hypothetical protein
VPRLIEAPVRVEAAGTPPKLIEEYAPDTVHRDED